MKAITGGKLIVPDERGIFRVLSEHAILYGQNIERIVPEEGLGKEEYYAALGRELNAELEGLLALDTQSLLEARYRRFRRIGQEANP